MQNYNELSNIIKIISKYEKEEKSFKLFEKNTSAIKLNKEKPFIPKILEKSKRLSKNRK